MNFENFTIRPVKMEDVPNYFYIIDTNRDRISKYFPKTVAAIRDEDSTKSFLAGRIAAWEKKEFISFVIVHQLTQQIIGSIFLKDIDWNTGKCEFGFFIDKNYERKGIISKTLSLMIDHCFHELKLNKVFMRIAEDNLSSRRVAEKNGFVVEGLLRQDFKTSAGQLIDVLYFGLLNTSQNK